MEISNNDLFNAPRSFNSPTHILDTPSATLAHASIGQKLVRARGTQREAILLVIDHGAFSVFKAMAVSFTCTPHA